MIILAKILFILLVLFLVFTYGRAFERVRLVRGTRQSPRHHKVLIEEKMRTGDSLK